MVLIIDAGNSNIVLATYDADKLLFTSRIRTAAEKTEDEYGVLIRSILRLHHQEPSELEGVMISSVVPRLLGTMKKSAKLLSPNAHILTLEPGLKTGLDIKIDNPTQLGADLVAVAIGAIEKYPLPALIIDLGTATKFCVVDKNRCFRGCAIMPGVHISLEALSDRAAQLPVISLEGDNIKVLGTNTIDSIRSGVVLGTASMVDGMIDRFEAECGPFATMVACGGLGSSIVPHCHRTMTLEPDLLLGGLYAIYRKNC